MIKTSVRSNLTFVCFAAVIGACSPLGSQRNTKNVANSGALQQFTSSRTLESKAVTEKRLSSVWTSTVVPLSTQSNLRVIKFANDKVGWIAGSGQSLFRSNDGGRTWTRIATSNFPEGEIVSLSFVSPETAWVLLQKTPKHLTDFQGNEYSLMRSNDGGKNWTNVGSGKSATMSRVAFANENSGWLVGTRWVGDETVTQTYVVLKTSDGGLHWTDKSSELVNLAQSPDAASRPNRLFQDGITDVSVTSSSQAAFVSLHGRIFRTPDGGETWEKVGAVANEPEQSGMAHISTTSAALWVLGGSMSIEGSWGMLAEVKGDQWMKYSFSDAYVTDLLHVSENSMLACGSQDRGNAKGRRNTRSFIIYSSDGGHRWLSVYSKADASAINALAFSSAHEAWAVGDKGLVVRLTSH